MSNATIGSYSAGEWGRVQADAARYQQLRKEYGSLRAAREAGVDTKTTKSGLSLSNAYNTTRVMSGNRQYQTNISKRTGLHLEGKQTSYNRYTTMSVKVGRGNTVKNTKAAGGAKTPQNKNIYKNKTASQQASKAFQKSGAYKPSTSSGSKSSTTSKSKTVKTKTKKSSSTGRKTGGSKFINKTKTGGRGAGGLNKNKKGTVLNKKIQRDTKRKYKRR